MNVEARDEAMTEFWPKWQNEVINGVYSLRRLLHASGDGAVFLADCKVQDLHSAAIKIVPAEQITLAQLSYWRAAADLSHPHLMRLFDAGLCQLEGRQFLYVVMEYAEQTLSQVLVNRPLTSDEAQEMLPPIVDALAFLHRKNLVQGDLKPRNILVVNDQLKLASDTIRPSGDPRASIAAESSPYDPPEAVGGRLAPAGDIWGLGVTLTEALAQRLPAAPSDRSLTACLPSTVAPALINIIQRCLSHDPASRPTALDLQAPSSRAPPAPALEVSADVAREVPRPTPPTHESPKPRALVPIIATVAILLLALWVGLRLFQSPSRSPQAAASTLKPGSPAVASTPKAVSQTPPIPPPMPAQARAPSSGAKSAGPSPPPPPRPLSRPSDQPEPPLADAELVHEELPSVPHSASATIHGHVKVTVLAVVDSAGNVTSAILKDPGPSAYFARLAREAAKKWKFNPVETQDARERLLRFEFTRTGTTASVIVPRT